MHGREPLISSGGRAARPVFQALRTIGVDYDAYEHPPVFTTEDVERYWRGIPATPVKNLFLRNKKGNRHYLVIVGVEKRVDLQPARQDHR